MTNGRETVIGNIRRGLAVAGGEDGTRRAAVEARLRDAPVGIIPKRAQLPQDEKVALFIEMAKKAAATVARVDGADGIPAAVAAYLREHNLPAAIRTGTGDPVLDGLDWDGTQVEVGRGRAEPDDHVSLSRAEAGIAEIGTLVFASGPDNPTTLNFMPDVQIAVVRAGDVVGDYETSWARIRKRFGKGVMPRTVNQVAGPSRSADIEQTLLLGAHGPRNLHILVVD